MSCIVIHMACLPCESACSTFPVAWVLQRKSHPKLPCKLKKSTKSLHARIHSFLPFGFEGFVESSSRKRQRFDLAASRNPVLVNPVPILYNSRELPND